MPVQVGLLNAWRAMEADAELGTIGRCLLSRLPRVLLGYLDDIISGRSV